MAETITPRTALPAPISSAGILSCLWAPVNKPRYSGNAAESGNSGAHVLYATAMSDILGKEFPWGWKRCQEGESVGC